MKCRPLCAAAATGDTVLLFLHTLAPRAFLFQLNFLATAHWAKMEYLHYVTEARKGSLKRANFYYSIKV